LAICSSRGFLFRLFLFDDVAAAEANLFEHVVGHDEVPIAEAKVELLDVFTALFERFLILVELALVFLLDSLAVGDDGLQVVRLFSVGFGLSVSCVFSFLAIVRCGRCVVGRPSGSCRSTRSRSSPAAAPGGYHREVQRARAIPDRPRGVRHRPRRPAATDASRGQTTRGRPP